MAKGSYHVNEASAVQAQTLQALKLMASLTNRGDVSPVTIYQDGDGKWTVAVSGTEYKDLSMNRAIERAARAHTTVFDK